MVQTVDGALGEQITLLQRMRELAVQSSTDTFSSADRTMMETEYDQLVAELDRIGDESKWNTQEIGTGTAFKIQVGADKDMDIGYTAPDMDDLVTNSAGDRSVVNQNQLLLLLQVSIMILLQ